MLICHHTSRAIQAQNKHTFTNMKRPILKILFTVPPIAVRPYNSRTYPLLIIQIISILHPVAVIHRTGRQPLPTIIQLIQRPEMFMVAIRMIDNHCYRFPPTALIEIKWMVNHRNDWMICWHHLVM